MSPKNGPGGVCYHHYTWCPEAVQMVEKYTNSKQEMWKEYARTAATVGDL